MKRLLAQYIIGLPTFDLYLQHHCLHLISQHDCYRLQNSHLISMSKDCDDHLTLAPLPTFRATDELPCAINNISQNQTPRIDHLVTLCDSKIKVQRSTIDPHNTSLRVTEPSLMLRLSWYTPSLNLLSSPPTHRHGTPCSRVSLESFAAVAVSVCRYPLNLTWPHMPILSKLRTQRKGFESGASKSHAFATSGGTK